jgi:hypothetical protein
MKHPFLLTYQLLTGLSDTFTGAMLIAAPAFTVSMLRLDVPSDAAPYVSFIGAFVLSVGLAGFYGAWVVYCADSPAGLGPVWLLTAFTRSAAAIFLFASVFAGTLESEWLTVAIFDGVLVLIQAAGMRTGRFSDVTQ